MRRTDAKQQHNLRVIVLACRNGQQPHNDVEREEPLQPRLAPVDGVIEACRPSKRRSLGRAQPWGSGRLGAVVDQGRLTHHIVGERAIGRGIGSELSELLPHRRLYVAELGLGVLGGGFHGLHHGRLAE